MKGDFPYKPFPGRMRGWVRKASLWEGPDHVLLIRGTRFQEEYRRFYYSDVQSLQMVSCFRWGSFGWSAFALLFGVISWISSTAGPNPFTSSIATGLTSILVVQLLLAWRFGCRCFVQTAVSREELPCLIRTWAAEKAFERLRARILEAQGTLPSGLGDLLDKAALETAPPGPAEPVDNGKEASRSVNLALTAFVLFLADAAETYPALLSGSSSAAGAPIWRYLTPLQILLTTAGIVSSLLIGLRVRRLKVLRVWLIAALAIQAFDFYVSIFLRSLFTVQGSVVSMNIVQLKLWRATMNVDVIALMAIGFGGIVFTLLNWNGLRRGDL